MKRAVRLGELTGHVIAERIGTLKVLFWSIAIGVAWIVWNSLAPDDLRFDPFPFILGNLVMSAEAALTLPVLLVAQRYKERQADEAERRRERKLDRLLALQEKR